MAKVLHRGEQEGALLPLEANTGVTQPVEDLVEGLGVFLICGASDQNII